MMLTLLISGPKQLEKDIDVYFPPLMDDLKILWNDNVEMYDTYRLEAFTLEAVLLCKINDFPTYGNMCGCTIKCYFPCPICKKGTFSKSLKHSRKM